MKTCTIIILLLILPLIYGQTQKIDSLKKLIVYDKSVGFQLEKKLLFEEEGAQVFDISFASPVAKRIPAYLVIPSNKGKCAGMIYGHWGNGNRSEFLSEAILLGKYGVLSIIIDYPWERQDTNWVDLPGSSNPQRSLEIYLQTIMELQRAFDLLISFENVDQSRIGYVGHSFGAQWGAILSAIDKRMKTVVLMCGVPTASSLFLETNLDQNFINYKKSLSEDRLPNYVKVVNLIDPIDYVRYATPVTVFFQFAKQERVMYKYHMKEYFDAASSPKRVEWYNTGHELLSLKSILDRIKWLNEELDLTININEMINNMVAD